MKKTTAQQTAHTPQYSHYSVPSTLCDYKPTGWAKLSDTTLHFCL